MPKYKEQPITNYIDPLSKFDISDCLTFEAVVQKFPDSDHGFLMELIHSKRMKISEYDVLEFIEEKPTEPSGDPYTSEKERETLQTISSDDSHVQTPLLRDQYRLHLDLDELPRMRIGTGHRGIEQPEREFERKETSEWSDVDGFEEDKDKSIRSVYPHRRHVWWTVEDRKPFSYYEMQREREDYCEECGNFGSLLYCGGLFLCVSCQYALGE